MSGGEERIECGTGKRRVGWKGMEETEWDRLFEYNRRRGRMGGAVDQS